MTPTSHIVPTMRAAMAALVAMVLSQGCQPLAHQADRQAMLQDEQIGGADAEHARSDAGRADSASRPQRDRARYSRTVSVVMSPMPRSLEIARAGMVNGVAAAPEIVGRKRQRRQARARPSR